MAFRVGGEEYAIDILKVLEITPPLKVTPVRRAPRWIEGIVNLRERVLPVVDLSRRLGAEPDPARAEERRIIIARTRGQIVGFIVDGVREVLRIPISRIDPLRGRSREEMLCSSPAWPVWASGWSSFSTSIFFSRPRKRPT